MPSIPKFENPHPQEMQIGNAPAISPMIRVEVDRKPVIRLTTIKDAKPLSNEAELVGKQVAITKYPCTGMRGKIARVVTAERINEEARTRGHRDVFYTVETDERFITGLMWQDFLQLPRM